VPSDDPVRRRARQLAAQAAESGDPAGWFETLYAEARDGQAVVPWDDGQPNPHLTQWAQTAAERGIAGPGRRALVVGCGVGGDPAFLADLGCQVTAFDVSPTAIAEARERFPDEPVDYQVADLLTPPPNGRARSTWSRRSTPSRPCTARRAPPLSGPSPVWSPQAAPCWSSPAPPTTRTQPETPP